MIKLQQGRAAKDAAVCGKNDSTSYLQSNTPWPMETKSHLHQQFREYLVAEFKKRRTRNPAYSLRAFGRSLKINDSTLSQIIRGRRELTMKSIMRLSASLGISLSDLSNATNDLDDIHYLKSDHAKRLAHWYFDAILELADTGFSPLNEKTVSDRLGIHSLEAKEAIRTLQSLGYLSGDENSPANELGSSTNVTDPEVEDATAKAYQQGLLELSQEAIDFVPKADRDHTSVVLAMNPEDLKIVRERIAECRREIIAMVEKSSLPKTEVYALQVSAFPLTQIKNEGSLDLVEENENENH